MSSRKGCKPAVKGASISPDFLMRPEGRRAVIASEALHMGLQDRHTPWPLTEQIVGVVAEALTEAQRILVLFNLEFLEVLHGLHREEMQKVVFIADTPMEREFAEVVYGVKALHMKDDEWTDTATWSKYMKMNGAADITLTNPPYNGSLDLKILMAMDNAKLLKRVVCVHPSTWLVDVKTSLGATSGNPTFRKFQNMVAPHLKSVHMFNGNPVFGIGLFVPCVITDMDMGWTRQQGTPIKVKDVGQDKYREVFDINDITLHGKAWDPLVKDFMGRVQKLCAKNGSLLANKKVYSSCVNRKTCIQLAGIRGNVSTNTMVNEDFYTFVQKDPSTNKGLRKQDDRMIVLDTATVTEQDNLLSYLQTDFSRLCLSILKLKGDLDRGELTLVPWLDFTRSWNDDQLFAMLGYPRGHAIREYAKQFLPDYHNIYPNGKTY
jgi:hypothetical protein